MVDHSPVPRQGEDFARLAARANTGFQRTRMAPSGHSSLVGEAPFQGHGAGTGVGALPLTGFSLSKQALGNGGTAVVHLARPHAPTRDGAAADLAVKVFRPRPLDNEGKEQMRALRREVMLLQEVKGHPHVVTFHASCAVHLPNDDETCGPIACSGAGCTMCSLGAPCPRPALIFEHLSGGDLWAQVKRQPMGEARAAEVLRGLLSGLVHIHMKGIVHRDIKAENLLLAADGRPVIVDFGSAAYLTDKEEMLRQCGSPGHIAPEVILGQQYGTKVDTFASGVTLYFLVSGTRPFGGKTIHDVLRRTVSGTVPFKSEHFDKVGAGCKAFILALLMRSPADRPSAEAAQAHFWLEGEPCAKAPDSPVSWSSNSSCFNSSWVLASGSTEGIYNSGPTVIGGEPKVDVSAPEVASLKRRLRMAIRRHGVPAGEPMSPSVGERVLQSALQEEDPGALGDADSGLGMTSAQNTFWLPAQGPSGQATQVGTETTEANEASQVVGWWHLLSPSSASAPDRSFDKSVNSMTDGGASTFNFDDVSDSRMQQCSSMGTGYSTQSSFGTVPQTGPYWTCSQPASIGAQESGAGFMPFSSSSFGSGINTTATEARPEEFLKLVRTFRASRAAGQGLRRFAPATECKE